MRPLRPNLSATSLIRDTKKPMGHGRKAIETTPLSHWLYKPIPLRYQPYPIEMLSTTGHLKNKKWMHYRWKNTSLPILQIDDFKSALFQVLHLDFPVI